MYLHFHNFLPLFFYALHFILFIQRPCCLFTFYLFTFIYLHIFPCIFSFEDLLVMHLWKQTVRLFKKQTKINIHQFLDYLFILLSYHLCRDCRRIILVFCILYSCGSYGYVLFWSSQKSLNISNAKAISHVLLIWKLFVGKGFCI